MTKEEREQKARIFAKYIESEVQTKLPDEDGHIKIGYLTGLIQGNGFLELEVQLHDGKHAAEEPTMFQADEMLLRLKDLQDISDEDAIEVAKMLGWTSGNYTAYIAAAHEFCHQVQNATFSWTRWSNWVQAADKLRELGYNLGDVPQDMFINAKEVKDV